MHFDWLFLQSLLKAVPKIFSESIDLAHCHAGKFDLLGTAWSARSIKRHNGGKCAVRSTITKARFGEHGRTVFECRVTGLKSPARSDRGGLFSD